MNYKVTKHPRHKVGEKIICYWEHTKDNVAKAKEAFKMGVSEDALSLLHEVFCVGTLVRRNDATITLKNDEGEHTLPVENILCVQHE